MGVLADHEGPYELSRLIPAGMLALACTMLAFFAVQRVWARSSADRRRPLLTAGVGFALVVVGSVIGMLTRRAAGGSVICGPVLHVIRDDSAHCDAAMARLPELVAVFLVAGALVLAAAVYTVGRDRDR